MLQHIIFVITQQIQDVYILLVHFEVFQFMRYVRQFGFEQIGYKTNYILCSPGGQLSLLIDICESVVDNIIHR